MDPFYTVMPSFFDLTFKELMEQKHPTAWLEFERGELTEEEFLNKFFKDNRYIDAADLHKKLAKNYKWVPGMMELLGRLRTAGFQLHAFSNYPIWWKIIEQELRLSDYLSWSFVSCHGPMKGFRKPEPFAYKRVEEALRASFDSFPEKRMDVTGVSYSSDSSSICGAYNNGVIDQAKITKMNVVPSNTTLGDTPNKEW
eukprot:CAMPEP_0175040060 /NCGR_PEP_ID=MMETSP0052_2-20121109/1019_1 /TAXON_ID=51329 ORGANISM="Polytomella parva, Strain SAG 63-3" /NCGR_SAMPLE_ID=MMETSP0052_2 /ASSEMBLY_ACC=CAM_ASM_000194 /LENGTH=197 /DNA_ID=CAMNT_0016302161 /DNA_START=453 /DNA_END=1043 /DNA_ORIENTATION=+